MKPGSPSGRGEGENEKPGPVGSYPKSRRGKRGKKIAGKKGGGVEGKKLLDGIALSQK